MTYFLNFRASNVGGPVIDPQLLEGDGTVNPLHWSVVPADQIPHAWRAATFCSRPTASMFLNSRGPARSDCSAPTSSCLRPTSSSACCGRGTASCRSSTAIRSKATSHRVLRRTVGDLLQPGVCESAKSFLCLAQPRRSPRAGGGRQARPQGPVGVSHRRGNQPGLPGDRIFQCRRQCGAHIDPRIAQGSGPQGRLQRRRSLVRSAARRPHSLRARARLGRAADAGRAAGAHPWQISDNDDFGHSSYLPPSTAIPLPPPPPPATRWPLAADS